MAIITIYEQVNGLGHEIAARTSQRLDFVLVDSALISHKLNNSDALSEKDLIDCLHEGIISPRLIKKLIVEQALENNVILLNLGGEVLFQNFPGTLHVKVTALLNKKESRKPVRKSRSDYRSFIKELYGKQNLGSDLYDLQIKVENMDSDFAVDLILKSVEIKGITAKAGVTWRALKKLKASLERTNSFPMRNEGIQPLAMPSFAHPSEKDFASVLDFYRIKWEYEPKSFIIQVDKEGKVKEEFTPDFYLPDLDLYIELTTLKQKLVTKKNRKIRKVKELYPNIKIKIFYGKDYKQLLHRFGIK
jgi:hypothetical protein